MKLKSNFLYSLLGISLVLIMISCNNSLTSKEKENYLSMGKEISKESFRTLSGKLKGQIQKGGIAHAIPFCNSEALPITKELSKKYKVNIKRTSNKIRNSKNTPSDRELKITEKYINLKNNNKELIPIAEKVDNKVHFYAPIVIKNNCLVCHGTVGKELTVKNDSIIKKLYPNDKAINYKEGEVRGIWSITFNKIN